MALTVSLKLRVRISKERSRLKDTSSGLVVSGVKTCTLVSLVGRFIFPAASRITNSDSSINVVSLEVASLKRRFSSFKS